MLGRRWLTRAARPGEGRGTAREPVQWAGGWSRSHHSHLHCTDDLSSTAGGGSDPGCAGRWGGGITLGVVPGATGRCKTERPPRPSARRTRVGPVSAPRSGGQAGVGALAAGGRDRQGGCAHGRDLVPPEQQCRRLSRALCAAQWPRHPGRNQRPTHTAGRPRPSAGEREVTQTARSTRRRTGQGGPARLSQTGRPLRQARPPRGSGGSPARYSAVVARQLQVGEVGYRPVQH